MSTARGPGASRPAPQVTYHVRQLDVGEAVDQRLAEVGELMVERLVLAARSPCSPPQWS